MPDDARAGPHGGSGAPLILTAALGQADQRWADALRRAHFPPERNRVPAHLTLFHALPPLVHAELMDMLRAAAAGPAPSARVTAPFSLGRGVALRVDAPDLLAIRDVLAERFHGLLTAQDRATARLHITIQNKVSPDAARALLDAMRCDFCPRPLRIVGLDVWRYLGGPWAPAGGVRFRGARD